MGKFGHKKIYPLHLGHNMFREIGSFLVVPLYKSSRETFNGCTTSSPCLFLLLKPLPPIQFIHKLIAIFD